MYARYSPGEGTHSPSLTFNFFSEFGESHVGKHYMVAVHSNGRAFMIETKPGDKTGCKMTTNMEVSFTVNQNGLPNGMKKKIWRSIPFLMGADGGASFDVPWEERPEPGGVVCLTKRRKADEGWKKKRRALMRKEKRDNRPTVVATKPIESKLVPSTPCSYRSPVAIGILITFILVGFMVGAYSAVRLMSFLLK